MGCGNSKEAPQNEAPMKKVDEKTNDKPTKENNVEQKSDESNQNESLSKNEVSSQSAVDGEKSDSNKEVAEVVISASSSKDDEREEVEIIAKVEPPSQPEHTPNFDHQMGGHEGTFQKIDESKIMKQTGKAETAFYEILHTYPSLEVFAPKFYGTKEVEGHKYIVIEDLTQYFKKPCILDVKIGRQSYGEDATPEKIEAMGQKDKNSTTYPLGARITAMKVYNVNSGDYVKKGKKDGQSVTVEGFQAALSEYFHNGVTLRKNLIPSFLEKVEKVRDWIENQGDVRLYSSSLLFLYDGDESSEDIRTELRIIDFAHVHKIQDGGKDDGYIFGINNLIKTLRDIEVAA